MEHATSSSSSAVFIPVKRYQNQFLRSIMPNSGGPSRKKFFCILIIFASSAMCYLIVTSPIAPVLSPAYQCHAYITTNANALLDREMLQHATTGEKANCSCSKEVNIDEVGGKPMEQNSTSNNRTTSDKKSKGSHQLIPKNGKTIMNDSLTGKLWNFKDIGDQQLYLYESLLKQKWSLNLTKTEILRQELAKYRSELDDNSRIILHQNNVKLKEAVRFVFGKQVKAMSTDVFKYLPKSNLFPERKRYKSCAVIGNSGIMQNSGCGKNVDEHDFVFRCNLAPVAPFREDAGIKSNFTTMNPSIIYRHYHNLNKAESLKKYNADISQYDGVIWIPCYSFGGQFATALKAITKFKGPKPKMVCGHPMHFKAVVDFWVERELNQRISTGFYLVTTALQLCDEVQLYGFWPFSARYGDSKTDVPYHYFDNLSANAAKEVHSMDKEFNILVQLHTLGILRLNVGTCSR